MTTTGLLLLLSATLVASGVVVIWRDVQRGRRQPFLARADATAAHPDVEVTVARAAADAGWKAAPSDPVKDPVARWAALEPEITAAVDRVNTVLAAAGVAIGAAGKPSRSLMKGGYGVNRRILVGGESAAWLRIELGSDGRMRASVKAHKDELAALNAEAVAPADGLNVARTSDLISECLKPAVSLAMRAAQSGSAEQRSDASAWQEVDAPVAAALRAANGALAQAGARFLPLGAPAWVEEAHCHRLSVAIEVEGAPVARMLIEHGGGGIEVAVGLPEPRLASLGRRQRLPVQGLTTHTLAELIANCAWPAIAHFREAGMGEA